jgi:hypothetical protein
MKSDYKTRALEILSDLISIIYLESRFLVAGRQKKAWVPAWFVRKSDGSVDSSYRPINGIEKAKFINYLNRTSASN